MKYVPFYQLMWIQRFASDLKSVCLSTYCLNYLTTFLYFSLVKIKVKICFTFHQRSCGIFRVEDNNILENPYSRPITLESNDSRISIIGNGSITIRDNPSFGKNYCISVAMVLLSSTATLDL